MLGYVNIVKNLLSPEEQNIYKGYYCGVCKSIGERYGQIPRLALSYDAVFLAMILSSLSEMPEAIVNEHCIVHPIKETPTVKGDPALDYAADMLLILGYFNFLDDMEDEHRLRGMMGKAALKGAYERIQDKYPDTCSTISESLSDLAQLEKSKSGNLDLLTEVFGRMLAAVFKGYSKNEREARVLESLGLNLGKWIYLMDALDDFEKDEKSGSYNPLRYRAREMEGLDALLFGYLGQVSKAVDLLDIRKNKGIIDNILWFGLRARTEILLEKED